MELITGVGATGSALNAQKTRLDLIAQNIANAQTTRSADGGPYKRQVVTFEAQLANRMARGGQGVGATGVKVASISNDPTPGQKIYDPRHPDADAQGMVAMPNVNVSTEMVDLITASRTYEANLSVVKAARQMAQKTIDIGR
jgi:flagellar basal-body rod protein FlgC